jgi:glycosyltransferase involved in cell wall biosynthesis
MTGIKRVSDVLISFKRLLDSGVDATLCMVGDGPDRVPAERDAKELGIAKSVLWTGYQRDVSPYYSMFDTLVLPSANEGTPVVAIEALAGGCPVVATRVGGVPDVVDDGEDGVLVEVGDVDAIAAALALLARDPELRRRMGERGRELVVPRYRVERLIDDVDSLYRELLSEKGLPLPPSA